MAASEGNRVSEALRFGTSSKQEHRRLEFRPIKARDSQQTPFVDLKATIEHEIIPRLLLSHLHTQRAAAERASLLSFATESTELADCILADRQQAARAVVDRVLERGVSIEQVFLRVIAEACRVLGRYWEEDTADFMAVTVAMGAIQQLFRKLSEEFAHESLPPMPDRQILLVPMPGESHSFGLAMVAEIFRRRGWCVDDEAPMDVSDLLERVSQGWFHVIGISLSCQANLPLLADSIRRVRQASRNRRIGVMVGGPLFSLHPDWQSRVGADACSDDALHAVGQAETLVGVLVNAPDD